MAVAEYFGKLANIGTVIQDHLRFQEGGISFNIYIVPTISKSWTPLVLQTNKPQLGFNEPAFQVDTNSSDSDLEIGQLWLELALDTMHLFEDTRQGFQLTFEKP